MRGLPILKNQLDVDPWSQSAHLCTSVGIHRACVQGILRDTERLQLLDATPASHHHTLIACLAGQRTNMAAAGVGCSQIICNS